MSVSTIPKKYNRAEAAEYLGMSCAGLDRALLAKRIDCYRPSQRRVFFLEHHLIAYLDRNSTCASDNRPAESVTIGSPAGQTRRAGAGHGASGDKRNAKASALKILKRPS